MAVGWEGGLALRRNGGPGCQLEAWWRGWGGSRVEGTKAELKNRDWRSAILKYFCWAERMTSACAWVRVLSLCCCACTVCVGEPPNWCKQCHRYQEESGGEERWPKTELASGGARGFVTGLSAIPRALVPSSPLYCVSSPGVYLCSQIMFMCSLYRGSWGQFKIFYFSKWTQPQKFVSRSYGSWIKGRRFPEILSWAQVSLTCLILFSF